MLDNGTANAVPRIGARASVDGYAVNVLLSGPGGSQQAARTMMQAGAAIVRAGGAGVFIDNSAVVRGKTEAYTVGMHVLGLREVVMKRSDAESDDFGIIDVLRYMAKSEMPIDDGHVLADLNGPRFQAFTLAETAQELVGSPMHNPFGRLKLVSVGDMAESN